MKPENDIRQLFQKAAAGTDAGMDEKILAKVLAAHETIHSNDPVPNRSIVRSTIMRSSVTKVAVAAAVLVAVFIGISQLGGSHAGVAWGEVARKVEASRGVVYRHRRSASDPNYSIHYLSPTHSRTDQYSAGHIAVSHYLDFETMTASSVYHTQKHYWRNAPLGRQDADAHDRMSDPKWLVQAILSCEHRGLGRKTIDGVFCEGLETTDPAVFGGNLPASAGEIAMRLELWVSVGTQYPVLCEGNTTVPIDGKTQTMQWIMDQFQWDVLLGPEVFEPNIPADYEEI